MASVSSGGIPQCGMPSAEHITRLSAKTWQDLARPGVVWGKRTPRETIAG